jgi:hypothetical protein
MEWVYDDGGRKAAGFKGRTGDCVVRSIAIASGLPYADVYEVLSAGTRAERTRKRERLSARGASKSVRDGVDVRREWFKRQMAAWGFRWVPTMTIGSGCKVHLVAGELPTGRVVAAVSRHYTAVIDGVVRDTHDPQRSTMWFGDDGLVNRTSERCVYGYWVKA